MEARTEVHGSIPEPTAARSAVPIAGTRAAGRLRYWAPIAIFAALIVTLLYGLNHDPRLIPSALIDQPVPKFSLPPVKGRALGLASSDLADQVSLVNVFASWCVECRAEHPLLLELKQQGLVPIHGLNYKDQPDDAARWLNASGDPYTRTGADLNGRVAIDWGVYGVPETFVISKDGRIAHKHIGPLTSEELEKTILPLLKRLQQP
jgi:cytochrome c biogenesis protein CcmG, thiol:disulfide interchange protein DsbE